MTYQKRQKPTLKIPKPCHHIYNNMFCSLLLSQHFTDLPLCEVIDLLVPDRDVELLLGEALDQLITQRVATQMLDVPLFHHICILARRQHFSLPGMGYMYNRK